jgi:RNA polymerase sigma-70 factor, ECF subfamily
MPESPECTGGGGRGERVEPGPGTAGPAGGAIIRGLGDGPAFDDAALLGAIGNGSEEAFHALFVRWAPRLRRFLVRATGSREAGEDLLQEAFLRVLRAAGRFSPDAPPGAWLYRICANLSYSFWRKECHAPRSLSALASRGPGEAGGYPDLDRVGGLAGRQFASGCGDAARQHGPEALRLRGRFARDLEFALAELPANQRMAFLLKAGQGLTYQEAAEVLGCPEGTVKSRFHHAVLRLRVALREWEGGIITDAPLPARREASRDGL